MVEVLVRGVRGPVWPRLRLGGWRRCGARRGGPRRDPSQRRLCDHRLRACSDVGGEPFQQTLPAIFGGVLAEARTIVSVEGVWGVGVDDDLARLVGRFLGLTHGLDVVERNALVLSAVKAKHGRSELGGDVERLRGLLFGRGTVEAAVPGDSGLQLRSVRRIQPGDAPTPAKAGDGQARSIAATRSGSVGTGVAVGHH